MSDHFNALTLDALSVGETASAPQRAHLNHCAICASKLDALSKAHQAIRETPGYRRTWHRLSSALDAPVPWWRRALVVAPALVGVILVVLLVPVISPPPAHENREKGASLVSISVVRSDGVLADSKGLQVGEKVAVQIRPGTATYALVFGIDSHGEISRLWPDALHTSERLPDDPTVPLSPAFEVTDGSFLLVAALSNSPLEAVAIQDDLERSLKKASLLAGTPELPSVKNTQWVQRFIAVEPSR